MRRRRRNVELAWAFAALLAVVVCVRLAVVWWGTSPSPSRTAATLVIVALFVGVPAAYGLRGVLRDDDAPGNDEAR